LWLIDFFAMKFNKLTKSAFLILNSTFLIMGCRPQFTAEEIIAKSIEQHGGQVLDTATIEFDFREIHYRATHNNGEYRYERWYRDSIHDVLSNEGFTRYINDRKVDLNEEEKDKYSNSVNSVIYFALLPYKLDDPAVNAQLIGEASIEGEDYYEIKVTFDKQGGGSDYQDEFAYWINKETFIMDYLAYLYHTDEGGARFRSVYNQRRINGILLADYKNFKGPFPYPIVKMDSLFRQNELELLSEIELRNVVIK